MTNGSGRVVAIGLDGAEPTLIERWMDEGHLPTFADMRRRGAWGRLEGTRDFFSGSVWPSFITGASVDNHGFYGFAQLERGTGDLKLMYGKDNKLPPFYAQLADESKRVAVLDIAKMTCAPGVNGIQVAAWGSHSPANPPQSEPPELIDDLIRKFGTHPASPIDEDSNPDERYYRRLVKALGEGCRRREAMCVDLLKREPWDLFIGIFSEAHSAGHKLWQYVDPQHPDYDEHAPLDLRNSMLQVHQDLDRAIASIRDAASDDVTFMVFSIHGMGLDYNDAPTQLLPEFMRRFSGVERSSGDAKTPLKARVYEALRSAAPEGLRNAIKHNMSLMARARARTLYFLEAHDEPLWPKMRAFSLPSDEGGFIRINLKGREPYGIVNPEDYEAVCDEIVARLEELRDPVLDCPAVNRVFRIHEDYDGPYVDRLPDLVVEWAEAPLSALWSPTYGDIGKMQIHRSGSHRPRGFLLAEGPGIPEQSTFSGRSIDIPATILSLMGEPMQQQTAGTPLLPGFGDDAAQRAS